MQRIGHGSVVLGGGRDEKKIRSIPQSELVCHRKSGTPFRLANPLATFHYNSNAPRLVPGNWLEESTDCRFASAREKP